MLSISPQNLVLVVCFFLHSAFRQSFHLRILLAIPKYKYIEMAARAKKYTRKQGVNEEISARSTLSEAQVLCAQKFAKQNHT